MKKEVIMTKKQIDKKDGKQQVKTINNATNILKDFTLEQRCLILMLSAIHERR